MSRYREVYESWKADPEAFWANAAAAVHWAKPYDKVFGATAGQYGRWFPGALCNTAYNCLDRHVDAGRGETPALIYDSPVTKTKRTLTYRALRDEVAVFAAVLAGLGIEKGPRRHLHAHGHGGSDRHAGHGTPRSDPLGRIRRVRQQRARQTPRRCQAQGDRVEFVRC